MFSDRSRYILSTALIYLISVGLSFSMDWNLSLLISIQIILQSMFCISKVDKLGTLRDFVLAANLFILLYGFQIYSDSIMVVTNLTVLLPFLFTIRIIIHVALLCYIIMFVKEIIPRKYYKYMLLEGALVPLMFYFLLVSGISDLGLLFELSEFNYYIEITVVFLHYMTISVTIGVAISITKYQSRYKSSLFVIPVLTVLLTSGNLEGMSYITGNTFGMVFWSTLLLFCYAIFVILTSAYHKKSIPVFVEEEDDLRFHTDLSLNNATLVIVFLLVLTTFFLYLCGYYKFNLIISLIICLFIYLLISTTINKIMLKNIVLQRRKTLKKTIENIMHNRNKDLLETTERLERMISHDRHTDLPNRATFYKDVNQIIEINKPFIFIHITLTNLNNLSNLHDGQTISKLIKYFSDRLTNVLEKGDDVYRIAKDEFAIISFNVESVYLENFYSSLYYLSELEYMVDKIALSVKLKVGFSRYPEDVTNSKDLLLMSDLLGFEYRRGNELENQIKTASQLMKETSKRNTITQWLKEVNFDQEFDVYYQPQFDIMTGQIIGAEALIRWKRDDEFISPNVFIQIAESIGYISQISEWVSGRVMYDLGRWKEFIPDDFLLGINISPIILNTDDFSNFFIELAGKSNHDTSYFDFEITEYVELRNSPKLVKRLKHLSEMGINLSVDDFGTGYSSIAYMFLYNINRLKISKELVNDIAQNIEARSIIASIIEMSKSMGFKTIAEGVEYQEQLEALRELGCDQIQGYIWSKPMPVKEFEEKYVYKKV